jgi:hypothetical protein
MLKNTEITDGQLSVLLVSRLLQNEDCLTQYSVSETRKIFEWAVENLLSSKIMPVENWLETAFHLCKQRWDSSIEWMELLPVPKVLLMIEIVNKHVKAQEAEMKKSARKK